MTETREQTIDATLPKLVSIGVVAEIFGVSSRTILRWVADNKFPKPLRIGLRSHRWLRSDLTAFIEKMKAN